MERRRKTGEWSSRPRRVWVRAAREAGSREAGVVGTYPSVAAAARACWMCPQNVHAYLSGRAGKRGRFVFEYVD